MPQKTSALLPAPVFSCRIFSSPSWNAFVEHWAPVIYATVRDALGEYGQEPLPEIGLLNHGMHCSGATASFSPATGQVRLSTSVEGLPGTTLEKLTHEFIHGSLAQFPEGDAFYEESVADYSTWLMAHAPVWGEHREAMIQAAAYNIAQRRERALKGGTDWDRKRWAGGVFIMHAYGPWIISRLRQKKDEGDFTW